MSMSFIDYNHNSTVYNKSNEWEWMENVFFFCSKNEHKVPEKDIKINFIPNLAKKRESKKCLTFNKHIEFTVNWELFTVSFVWVFASTSIMSSSIASLCVINFIFCALFRPSSRLSDIRWKYPLSPSLGRWRRHFAHRWLICTIYFTLIFPSFHRIQIF